MAHSYISNSLFCLSVTKGAHILHRCLCFIPFHLDSFTPLPSLPTSSPLFMYLHLGPNTPAGVLCCLSSKLHTSWPVHISHSIFESMDESPKYLCAYISFCFPFSYLWPNTHLHLQFLLTLSDCRVSVLRAMTVLLAFSCLFTKKKSDFHMWHTN